MLRSVLPRFEIVVDCPVQAVAASLEHHLAGQGCECSGWVEAPYAELHVPEGERHFWSPRLQVTLDARAQGTIVHGCYRPEPEVWTGFVFAHSVFGVVALAGLSLGLAQWTLGHTPLAMIVVGVAALASASLYIGALFGHSLGHEQMCMLRRDFDEALGTDDPSGTAWDPIADGLLDGPCEAPPRE